MRRAWGLLLSIALVLAGCSAPTAENGYQAGYEAGFAAGQTAATAAYQKQIAQLQDALEAARQPEAPVQGLVDMTPLDAAPSALPPEGVQPAQPALSTTSLATGIVKGKAVNLRAGPGTEYEVVQQVSRPAAVEVWAYQGDWCQVTVKGVPGYLRQDMITGLTKNDTAAANAAPKVGVTPSPTPKASVTPSPTAKAGDTYVWLSATGSKYHNKSKCGNMDPTRARQVTLESVQGLYEPCKTCFG